MAVTYAFLNLWYYFTSAYYVKLLCFFTELYNGRLFSLSILRVVWYKVEDSELWGNCSQLTCCTFLCLPLVYVHEGQMQSVYVYLHLRVGRGETKKKNQFSPNLDFNNFSWHVLLQDSLKKIPFSNFGNRLFQF